VRGTFKIRIQRRSTVLSNDGNKLYNTQRMSIKKGSHGGEYYTLLEDYLV